MVSGTSVSCVHSYAPVTGKGDVHVSVSVAYFPFSFYLFLTPYIFIFSEFYYVNIIIFISGFTYFLHNKNTYLAHEIPRVTAKTQTCQLILQHTHTHTVLVDKKNA